MIARALNVESKLPAEPGRALRAHAALVLPSRLEDR